MTTITLIIEISCPFQKINHKNTNPMTVLIVCAENGHFWRGNGKMTVLINIFKSGHFNRVIKRELAVIYYD